jgi:hypothetical protein
MEIHEAYTVRAERRLQGEETDLLRLELALDDVLEECLKCQSRRVEKLACLHCYLRQVTLLLVYVAEVDLAVDVDDASDR